MNILLDKDIIQFKEHTNLEKDIQAQFLKEHFCEKFSFYINMIGFNASKINEVNIFPTNKKIKDWGSVKPIIKNNELYFNVSFADFVLKWADDKTNSEHKYATGIIMHEFYHCKEMLITSQYIDYKKIFFYNEYNTTYDYILDLARQMISEYYAFYYSSNVYSDDANFNLKQYIHDSSVSLYVLSDSAKENNEVYVPEGFMKKIKTFIYNCVKHLARYHYTNDISHLQVFDKYKDKKLYRLHYDYFIQLDPILKEIFALYPQQMSEEFLLIVGKNLFSIFNFYSLDYSTNDLSDTFVFKFVKNSGLSKTEL